MSTTWQKILIIAALVVSIAGYNFWPFAWKGFFYQSMAVGFVIVFALLREIPAVKTWATVGIWFSFNNLLGELIFDPTRFGWNEYAVALIIVIITLRNGRKYK